MARQKVVKLDVKNASSRVYSTRNILHSSQGFGEDGLSYLDNYFTPQIKCDPGYTQDRTCYSQDRA